MYVGSPIFPGKDKESQLAKIYNVLGTPTLHNFPDIQTLQEYRVPEMQIAPRDLKFVFPTMDDQAIDLLRILLQYSPARRATAEMAMKHRFFMNVMLPAASLIVQK